MKLILVDMNAGVCAAWQEYFKTLPEVEIINDYFENLPQYDCMVSAANSFGLMDGGVDAAITRFFGEGVMRRVQERIITEYLGEQPVGTCMLVETGNPNHPWVAHAPTMRIPMEIAHTDNVYLAMWAVLRAVHHHNLTAASPIHVLACPGLGTFTGKVPYREAARQMSLAYKNYLNPPTYITWQYASERQARVRFGGDDGFRFPTA
ncbi:MAG TPA: macro domain-containing protein [Aggregatilineales bacterium]|nr:macro domain-containing protein [Aggregatilineales bacterium]